MSNLDFHPRILSLSSSTNTPTTSTPATPNTQSRRASHESVHDAHNMHTAQEKTQSSLNQSIKNLWKDFKQHAAEHHRSVNAAFDASYGAGTRMGDRPYGVGERLY